jgi:signal transduction histidine kinase
MRRPVTLRRQVLWRLLGVALVGVGALCGLSLWTLHGQMHRQTDDLLRLMLETEVASLAAPPADPGPEHRRVWMQLDASCRPLDTGEGAPLPEAHPLCAGFGTWQATRILNVAGVDGEALRVAARDLARPVPQRVVVGLDHTLIDTSTWQALRLLLPLSLVLCGLLLLAPGVLLLRMGREFEALAEVSDGLHPARPASLVAGADALAAHPAWATDEAGRLAAALHRLSHRTAAVLAQQRDFLAEAAHELRTPLTALLGEVELALRRPRTAEAYHEALLRIRDNADHLGTLAEQLLTLARLQHAPGPPPWVDVQPTVAGAVQRMQAAARARGCRLVLASGEGPCMAWAHALLLDRILTNLLANALQHGEGDRVGVTLHDTADGRVTLVVEDNGRGVEPTQGERLFQPFHTAGPSGSSGLGLFLAREAARSMGGALAWAGPGAGARGARFVLTLDARPPADLPAHDAGRAEPTPAP